MYCLLHDRLSLFKHIMPTNQSANQIGYNWNNKSKTSKMCIHTLALIHQYLSFRIRIKLSQALLCSMA